MGKFLKKAPCDACGSKDNVALYEEEDGRTSGYCFGCTKHYYNYGGEDETNVQVVDFGVEETSQGTREGPGSYPYGTHLSRGVSDETAEFFGVRYSTAVSGDREDVYYPYDESWKVRKPDKSFRVIGGLPEVLFGADKFGSGGSTVVITEGEEDTLAIGEAYMRKYGRCYPVVSIPSSTNLKAVQASVHWLRSFDKVVLWMDKDAAGEKAKRAIAKIVGYDKTFVIETSEKDASDLLKKEGYMAVWNATWNAIKFNPQGILTSQDLWKQMEEYEKIESIPYPAIFQGLNEKLKGMRGGEITLFTSGTGAGKSSMMREIMLDVLENTEDKIGVISLEESPAEVARKLCSMKLLRNPSESEITLSELSEPFQAMFEGDRVLVLDHQGAITESITDQLNYMAAVGCKYLFVDHITILVSEGAEGLTGNEATDKVMNDLLKIAKTHNVWIGLVSHLRKSDKVGKSFEQGIMPSLDDIRGSGSIKQISNDIVAFARNSEDGENIVKLKVLKCRYSGLTGPADSLIFNRDTGRMEYGGAIADDF